MDRSSLYERRETPWQSMAPDHRHIVQLATNQSGITFWRAKLWCQNDKAWSQWMPLAKAETTEEAFKLACERLPAAEG